MATLWVSCTHSFFAITAGCEDGKKIACIVYDTYFAERQVTVVDKFLCLSRDDATIGSTHEGDVGCGCYGECTVTVGCSSKSQICEREKDTALHTAACIQVARFYTYLSTGIALCYFNYLYAVLSSKLVVQEEIF